MARSSASAQQSTLSAEVNENGDLPEGWISLPIAQACEVNPGKPAKGSIKPDTPVTFVPMSAVDADKGGILAPEERPFAKVQTGFTAFADNDVLMAKITPCMENGKAAVARGLKNGVGFGSTEFHVFRSQGLNIPDYIFHFIRQEQFRRDARLNMSGNVGQQRVPTTHFDEAEIPLPPLAEQRRIVAKVEVLLARVNAARERLAKVPPILKRFRQAVLAAACSGRLTEDWRDSNTGIEPASKLLERILKERRTKWESAYLDECRKKGKPPRDTKWITEYQEPQTSDSLDGELLPPEWRTATVEQLSIVIRGASPRPAGDPRFFGGTVPWITVGSITKDEQAFLYSTSETLTQAGREVSRYIEAGTFLLTNSGATLGVPKITKIAGCINDGSVALLNVAISEMYLYYFLKGQTENLRKINQGAAQPNLNTSIVKAITVPLPPLEEQREIVRRVEKLFKLADAIEKRVAAATARADRLTQAILAKAFRGELVPTEAELARRENRPYESAAELLKRIQAERAAALPKGPKHEPARKRTKTGL